jgi:hypothetical protein
MPSRIQISTLIGIVAGCWAAVLIAIGTGLPQNFFRPLSVVVGVVVLLMAIFDRWVWSIPLLRGWFVRQPDLRGTWCVVLQSTWRDPVTNREAAPIEAYLVVRQRYSHLSVRLLSPESSSGVLAASVLEAEDGGFQVVGVYRNEPTLSLRYRSPIHYGAMVLEVVGTPAVELRGHYWTDRDTRGEITTFGRHARALPDYLSARRIFARDASD